VDDPAAPYARGLMGWGAPALGKQTIQSRNPHGKSIFFGLIASENRVVAQFEI